MKNEVYTKLHSFDLPNYQEIPDVGLYLDQVSKYINSYIEPISTLSVTPSMISNYAKAKLFNRVNKKTYTRDQIAILFFIALTKNVLSIEYIRVALQLCNKRHYNMKDAYEFFRQELKHACLTFNEPAKHQADALNEDQVMLRNICHTIVHKIYLELYFEQLEISLRTNE